MGHAGNFNPEWGYLAPAPTFLRTARGFLIAAVIGGAAGAAVVLSLMDRPAAEASVAARTLVSAVESPVVRPLESTLLVGGAQAAVQPQDPAAPAGVAAPGQHPDTASIQPAPQGPTATTTSHAAGAAVGDHSVTTTTKHAPIAAALVEAPRIMAPEAPIARAVVAESSAAASAPEAATVSTPAAKAAVRRRTVGRGAPRYAAPRYDARPYAWLRQYGQY
jgi:hypothetical protein